MKYSYAVILTTGIVLFLFFSGCGTSKIVYDVRDPAEVQLPGGTEKIAVLNVVSASIGDDLQKVDELFKGEGELVNKIASQGAVNSFIKEVGELSDMQVNNLSVHPGAIRIQPEGKAMISWALVDSLCIAAGTEILVTLESFNSRTSIDYSSYSRKPKSDQVKIWSNTIAYDISTENIYIARLKVYIESNWKVYHPGENRIIMDRTFTDSLFTEADGPSQVEAEKRLPGKKNAIEDGGYITGTKFAARITPGRTTVQRVYFTSGNDDFKEANKFVKMRYWEMAAEFWEKNRDNPDTKIGGTAKYNLAIIREMNGNLDEAIQLAEDAYSELPKKLINSYIQILKERKIGIDDRMKN
ncbi:MAG: hypothetical protein JSV24_01965 [Bacteroidales bacterium]|nr:MAG: hypothetical protein JSV24_01965 [Bacteroidales bacterium]